MSSSVCCCCVTVVGLLVAEALVGGCGGASLWLGSSSSSSEEDNCQSGDVVVGDPDMSGVRVESALTVVPASVVLDVVVSAGSLRLRYEGTVLR